MAESEPTLIFETVHGSTAYGLAREGSDVDVKGIFVGPPSWFFSPQVSPEQIDMSADHVRYDVRKFFRLAMDANPTFLEIVFAPEKHHLHVNESGRLLIDQRKLFLSRRVAKRFGGYAMGQLKRIRTHRSHLLSPPNSIPTREEFKLPDRTVIPADQLAAAEQLIEQNDLAGADISTNFLELLHRERRYKAAMTDWQNYQAWLKGRNPSRSALEAKFGYDTKHAMHLVRLQRMAIEALTTGELNVHRTDRDELLAIRDGVWSFEELEAQAGARQDDINAAELSSILPDLPAIDALNALCVEIIERELWSVRHER
jgi:uncharacterized protein